MGREGILEPVKGRLKLDTVGLGVENKDTDRGGRGEREKGKGKVHKLNAKQVRKGAAENRRREERLREVFFGRDDVVRYLGEGI